MRRASWTAVACVALYSNIALADPLSGVAHLHSPRLACLGVQEALTDCIALPVGFFLDESSYSKLDVEMKRLQDAETRLTAENTSLRQSAKAWQPGWITVLSTLTIGVIVGAYADRKL